MAGEHILVVDDEEGLREYLNKLLSKSEYHVSLASDGEEALLEINQQVPDLILSDIKMPIMDGMILLEKIKRSHEQIPVIMMTAYGTMEMAIEAMKLGAYDYINKPFDIDEVLMVIDKALEKKRLEDENMALRQELESSYSFQDIISRNKDMNKIFETIKNLSDTRSSILISGETGTGKELVARAIHNVSKSFNKPFVTIDCGSLSKTILESELFGHVKGAFNGAIDDKEGLFESAKGGTVFFDEITNIPINVQATLLRVLENGTIKRVGENQERKVDFRLIAATHEDLEKLIKSEQFREDLYYRLNVVSIELPPLRERKEDITLLLDHFINKYNRLEKGELQTISEDALKIMMDYHWPGNVRELENLIHRAVVVKKSSRIYPKDLPVKMGKLETAESRDDIYRSLDFNKAKKQAGESFEKRFIIEVLKKYNGNVSHVAETIKLDRRNLQRKIKHHKINPKDYA